MCVCVIHLFVGSFTDTYSIFIDIYTCMIMDELDEAGAQLGTWFPYPCGVSSSTSAASEAEETCSWQEIRSELLLHLSFHITVSHTTISADPFCAST